MKKIFFLLIAIGFLVIAGFMVVQFKKHYNIAAALQVNSEIPAIQFYNLSGTLFSKESVVKEGNKAFVYFNTTCDHCQYEIMDLSRNLNRLSNTTFYFVSSEPAQTIEKFSTAFLKEDISCFKFLKDSNNVFVKSFGSPVTPTIVLYNSEGKFLKIFKGEVKIDAIIKVLNNGSIK